MLVFAVLMVCCFVTLFGGGGFVPIYWHLVSCFSILVCLVVMLCFNPLLVLMFAMV